MAFNVQDYLDFFEFRSPTKRGINWMSSCPDFDGQHNHGDKRFSWGIHEDTGVSNCFVCGGMSLELMTAKLLSRKLERGVSLLEAAEWLEERYGIKTPKPDELAKIAMTMKDYHDVTKPVPVTKIYPESILYPYSGKVHSSLLNHETRKFAIDYCLKWELGFDKISVRTVIPVRRQDGRLLGVISRAIRQNDSIRYMMGLPNIDFTTGRLEEKNPVKYTLEKKASGVLFGEHYFSNRDTILVVESALDVIWLDQLGFTDKMDVCAIIGAGSSQAQIIRLKGWERVILGLDADSAGKKGTEKLEANLQGSHIIKVDWSEVGGKDPGDLSKDKIEQALRQRKSIFNLGSWEEAKRNG